MTALRETLQDLRPNPNVRADYASFQVSQGVPVAELAVPAREVTQAWRGQHVLVPVAVQRGTDAGLFANLDDVSLRNELERSHGELLMRHGMNHLDIAEIRSKNRAVTQQISRDLYEQGAAGILYKSGVDDEQCIVLFEGRAWLEDTDEGPIPLTEEIQELTTVCREFGLLLR